jgi:hypothetical protein
MSYLSAKKIYPGNWAEPLNGWYKNIDNTQDGVNESSARVALLLYWPSLVIVTFSNVVTLLLRQPLASGPVASGSPLSSRRLIGRMTPVPILPVW